MGKKIINIISIINSLSFSDFVPPIFFRVKQKIRSLIKREDFKLKPFTSSYVNSFSQFQEDLIIDELFNRKSTGLYVDIGANDPLINSNTKYFYSRGWRGINIEPNIIAFNKIKEDRKEDCNLNLAISDKSSELTFYLVGDDSSISTLNKDQAVKIAKKTNNKLATCMVKTDTLSNIFDKYLDDGKIDFMSVDAEGHDFEVLKSNDWKKYRPALVLVEANINTKQIIDFMNSIEYLYIFSNNINALFIDKRFEKKSISEKFINL